MSSPAAQPVRRRSLRRHRRHAAAFLIGTVAWTWLWWWLAVGWGEAFQTATTLKLVLIGGAGPALLALGLLLAVESRHRRADFCRRLCDVRLLANRWGLLALALPAGLVALGLLGGYVHTGEWPEMPRLRTFAATPLTLIPMALLVTLFGPLPQEIGWRGYALEHLQRGRVSPVLASAIIAGVWMLWHVPLAFIPGTWYADATTVRTVLFFIELLPTALLMTWIYNRTHGSILAAVAYHSMLNFAAGLVEPSDLAACYQTGFAFLAAVAVVWAIPAFPPNRRGAIAR